MNQIVREKQTSEKVFDRRINSAPAGFNPEVDLPRGFFEFLLPLHKEFTPRQQELASKRAQALTAAHDGRLPGYTAPSDATTGNWRGSVPQWCADQRNQMTGPADDAELVVKMLNSGAPGVMLDLEDSMANQWTNHTCGTQNILSALAGNLTYEDKKRNERIAIRESRTVIFTRTRGLHLNQAGIISGEIMSASLFDAARVAFGVEAKNLRHPLTFYIPKSESAEEALWWRDLFRTIAKAFGWAHDYIKCMALVESHPLAYQMEEFIFNLREHLLGLNLGRWDYMASLIHFNFNDPSWVLPDRNTIPHNIPFFQNLREHMAEICHKRGVLAIGGMTALYPSRVDPALNARALAVLAEDKKNEANCLMDGAWTGHPDQNEIAVAQFPYPNQLSARRANAEAHPNLRPEISNIGKRTVEGTRAAIRTVIRYRYGVLTGKGASLLDGYMEDLATDRIYRLMIAQRVHHRDTVEIEDENGSTVKHTPEFITRLFDEELNLITHELTTDTSTIDRYREARQQSEQMITRGEFDPV